MPDSIFADHVSRISLNIRIIRQAKNLTVQELASRCNIERSNMSRIEAGRSNPTIKTLYLIAVALGVSFEFLVASKLKLADCTYLREDFKQRSLHEQSDEQYQREDCRIMDR